MRSALRTGAVLVAVVFPACWLTQCGGDARQAARPSAKPAPAPGACSVHVDPTTLPGEFGAAEPGDVLCLAAGRYQQFAGTDEAGKVTLRAERGAKARLPF